MVVWGKAPNHQLLKSIKSKQRRGKSDTLSNIRHQYLGEMKINWLARSYN